MLIDFHTHTQPDIDASREFFNWLENDAPENLGTVEELLPIMDEVGVERTLIVPWLPAQDLVEKCVAAGDDRDTAVEQVLLQWQCLNGWATTMVSKFPQRLSCLVGVDPVLMTPLQVRVEVEIRLAEGACGIKIAPMFLNASPDDSRIRLIWELASENGVFILSESGAHEFEGFGLCCHKAWGHPAYFEPLLADFPNVRVMLAHLGVGAEDDVARLANKYPNLYADLSLRLAGLGEPGNPDFADMLKIIRKIGADQVVYGTNYPIVDVREFAKNFAALKLTQDERNKIAFLNARSLLIRC